MHSYLFIYVIKFISAVNTCNSVRASLSWSFKNVISEVRITLRDVWYNKAHVRTRTDMAALLTGKLFLFFVEKQMVYFISITSGTWSLHEFT